MTKRKLDSDLNEVKKKHLKKNSESIKISNGINISNNDSVKSVNSSFTNEKLEKKLKKKTKCIKEKNGLISKDKHIEDPELNDGKNKEKINSKLQFKNIEDLNGDFEINELISGKRLKNKAKKFNDEKGNQLRELEKPEKVFKKNKDYKLSCIKGNDNMEIPNNKSIDDLTNTNYIKESIKDKVTKSQSRQKRKRITDMLAKTGPIAPNVTDFINEVKNYCKEKLTNIEQENISITESNIALCNDLTHTSLSFLKSLFPKWKKNISKCIDLPRRPLLLVICSSGIRCVNYIREISEFKIETCKIAKLFAKHMKIEVQQQFLQHNTIHIAVGTPNRLHHLLNNGDLSLDHLKFVVIDWSFRNGKQLRMIEQDQVKQDLMLLLQKNILPHVVMNQFKLALF